MKLLFLSILFLTFSSRAQTNIIALKSHSGDLNALQLEQDNFGDPGPVLKKITYLEGTCVKFTYDHWGSPSEYSDTICDHPLFLEHKFDVEKLREFYSSHIEFENFEHVDIKKMKQNNISWLIYLILPMYLIYVLGQLIFVKKN